MRFTQSLRKNRQFQEVYKKGVSRANRYLVMYVLENHQDENLLGISVSKKVGNSVVRHRVKRLVKESYRLHEDIFNSGLNIVITARASAASISFEQMESAVLHLGRLHHIMKEETKTECEAVSGMAMAVAAALDAIRRYLSPLKTTKCPYFPTCSEYGLEAVEKYGALKGGLLAVWRILRCNPFSKGGYDPVP